MELKDLFSKRSINVSAFARANGLKPTTIYNILNGSVGIENVGVSTFLKIANGLDMDAEQLIDVLEVREKSGITYAVVSLDGDSDD